MNQFDLFTKSEKTMFKKAIGIYIVLWFGGFLLSIGSIAGLIYFVFWCLKHFGVV